MSGMFQHRSSQWGRRRQRALVLGACATLMLAACSSVPDARDLASTKHSTDMSDIPSRSAAEQLSTIATLADQGLFSQADSMIDAALEDAAVPHELRARLAFERERMRRIRMDFSLTRADAIERARRQIPGLTESQFDRFDAQGSLESMTIDGERRYFNRAPSNLFRVSAEARALRPDPEQAFFDGPYTQFHPHHAEVLTAAQSEESRFVAPRRVRIEQSLSVNADAVPAGETVKVWIPYPRVIVGQQQDIVFLASEPPDHHIAPESALQRTVYLEKPARAGEPTEFSIRYELSIAAQRVEIDPSKVVPTPDDPSLAPFLNEEPPHIVFSDALRLYSAKTLGDETDPYRIVQKLFAAVDSIPWGGAREYSTIRNISDYALHADHADCGQQTLLLISLLRLSGIPARWQSGWVFSEAYENYANLHDWGQVFLAPYGWVPMDVTTGQLDSTDPSLRWFYLGGLDAYRVAFNDAISTAFDPPKQHVRSETVDSQRGEAEWRGGNLYFDQWDYGFTATILPFNAAPSISGEHQ